MSAVPLLVFSLFWLATVYAINCLIAQKLIRLDPKRLSVYLATMVALGVLGEIGFDSAYNLIFGQPLWEYRLLPIHNAYTSVYSLFLWGLVGFHIYLLRGMLERLGIKSVHAMAGIFCIDAIILEALVNLSSLAAFGGYIYYYNPADLWHITSIQALPLYLLAGYICVSTLRFANRRPAAATAGSTVVALALVGAGLLVGN